MADRVDDINQYIIYLFAGTGVPAQIYSDTTYTYTVTDDNGVDISYPKIKMEIL